MNEKGGRRMSARGESAPARGPDERVARPRRLSSIDPRPPRPARPEPQRGHAHGYRRREEGAPPGPGERPPGPEPRSTHGMVVLVACVVSAGVAVGLARVRAGVQRVQLAAELTELTDTRQALLDTRRRLLAERAFLRHPDRLRGLVEARLAMEPIAPDRIERIEFHPASEGSSP